MLDLTRAYGLTFLCPARDTTIGWCLRAYGEFARIEQDYLASFLEKAGGHGTMIDVGANIGAISLPLAKRFPACRFIGVEAHRGLAGIYAANALNNMLENVEWRHAAAGRESGLAAFPCVDLGAVLNFGGLGQDARQPMETVMTLRLDDFAPDDTRLIKIDVEGAEMEVLAGAERLLTEVKPVVFLEAKREGDSPAPNTVACINHLIDRGYLVLAFFSPFTTAQSDKHRAEQPAIKGDYSLVALPPKISSIWPLPRMHKDQTRWPGAFSHYSYLPLYGLESPKA